MAAKSFLDNLLRFIGLVDEDEDMDEAPYSSSRRPSSPGSRPASEKGRGGRENRSAQRDKGQSRPENVVNFKQESQQRQRTVIYRLHTIEDTRSVITDLIENKTILVNYEELSEHDVQRANDIFSGAAFALKASYIKTSAKGYLIAPSSVKVDNLNNYKAKAGDFHG